MSGHERTQAPYTGAFLFAGVFGLYLLTLAPTVTFWDSGELITAACTLGIPHQPGYPLYSLTGRLFSLFPLGNAAYRLNLLSAIFSSLCALVVYKAVSGILEHGHEDRPGWETAHARAMAAAVAAALSVSRILWSQSVVAEVYALNGFFVALLLYLHVLAVHGRLSPARYVSLSGFIFGLGVINHISLAIYFPALIIGWAAAAGRRPGFTGYVCGVFFMLLGLSIYLYLPVRAAAGPDLDIGHPSGWRNFLEVTRWAEYAASAPVLIGKAVHMAGSLNLTDWRIAAGIAVFGAAVVILVRDNARLYLPVIVFLTLYTAVISAQVLGSVRDIRFGLPPKFFIPTLVAAAVMAGGLAGSISSRGGPWGRRVQYAAITVVAVTALVAGYRNYHPDDMSDNFIAYDYAENSLKSAGERGVLLTWGDNGVFPLWYLWTVERYRDDVLLAHTPLLTYDWYLDWVSRRLGGADRYMSPYYLGENVYRLLKIAESDGRPFAYDYSAMRNLKLDETTLKVRGLVYFEGGAPPGDPWDWYVFRGVSDPDVYKDAMDMNIIEIYAYQARLSARLPALLFK